MKKNDFHKLEHGDIIKILPLVTSDNTIHHILGTSALYIRNRWIYDTKGYLDKLYFSKKGSGIEAALSISRKFWCAALINNEVKFISFGRTIRDILHNEYNRDKQWFMNNKQLLININTKQIGSMQLPAYDGSIFIEKEWDIPVNDMSEWKDWIKQNQPFYLDKFFEKNGVMANYDILNKTYDNRLSEIISEIRDNKINNLIEN